MVGGKYSFANYVFLPWQSIVPNSPAMKSWDAAECPLVTEWVEKMAARPGVKRVIEEVQPFFGRTGGKH